MTTMLREVEVPVFDQARYEAGSFDGIIEIPDETGDTKIMWDKRNPDEIEVARAAFKAAKKAKALIYRAEGKQGAQGEQVKEFNENDERVIVVPQAVGG